MLLPHATWRASVGHFVRALQACVHYFSAYPRTFKQCIRRDNFTIISFSSMLQKNMEKCYTTFENNSLMITDYFNLSTVTSLEQTLLEVVMVVQWVKIFSAFYGT
jgi:hypothetical protein